MKNTEEDKQEVFIEEFLYNNLAIDFPVEFHNIEDLAVLHQFMEKYFADLSDMALKDDVIAKAKDCYKLERSEILRYFIDNNLLSFSEVALERIRLFLSSLEVQIEEDNYSDGCIDFPTMQDALDYWRITDSNDLVMYGSWEELSNNHILFML